MCNAVRRSWWLIVGTLIIVCALTGCARQSNIHPIFAEDAFTDSSGMHTGEGTKDTRSSISIGDLGRNRLDAPYEPVYFTYDSHALTDGTLAALRRYAPQMRSNPIPLMLEGHCDERGTAEYNLALGEHRALAVKQQLVRLGVDGQTLTTISYGEESPAAPGHNESAWAKNRRVEFSRN